ncbi:hypothetical protein J6590_027042 [Homalodisca vitripennis]|nr:hypothetical protein J6590_027042 [Homalodisca vitripennis]
MKAHDVGYLCEVNRVLTAAGVSGTPTRDGHGQLQVEPAWSAVQSFCRENDCLGRCMGATLRACWEYLGMRNMRSRARELYRKAHVVRSAQLARYADADSPRGDRESCVIAHSVPLETIGLSNRLSAGLQAVNSAQIGRR